MGRAFADPGVKLCVIESGSDLFFEFVRSDPREIQKEIVERAVEVVFTGGSGENGTAFVESSAENDKTAQRAPGASRVSAI
jgi:hypothetical protein